MRRFFLVIAAAWFAFLLLPAAGFAESKTEAIRLFNEAEALRKRAQTNADLQRAVQKYHRALRIFERVRFKKGIGVATNNLGLVFADWGQYDKAVSYYEKSLAIKRELKDRRGEGKTLNNLGDVYAKLHQHDNALKYYEKSVLIKRELNDTKGEAMVLRDIGLVYERLGKAEKALAMYDVSLAIRRRIRDRMGEGLLLLNFGRVCEDLGQYDKAVSYYEKSLAISRELKNRRGESKSLGSLGNVYKDLGKYDKAVEYYKKSLAISRELKDRGTEGKTLINLGNVYSDWGQYDKAVSYYDKSLAISRELKNRRGEGSTLNSLGLVYYYWGQYDKAVSYYEKDLAIKRELKDRRGEGQPLCNLGLVYKALGQYPKAVEVFEASLAIAREYKVRKSEASALINLGNVYSDWGQYDRAVSCYDKSLAICRELKDRRGEGKTLNNLGSVYYYWGQYAKAISHYEKDLAICRELKDRRGEGKTLNNLGNVYSDWGQYDKAVSYYEKSLAICRELKDRRGEGSTLNNLGSVYYYWGQYDKAVSYYEKSLAVRRELKDRRGEGSTLGNLGNVYSGWGQYDKAVSYYEKDLAICRELKDRRGEGKTLNNLGIVYKNWGQYDKAVSYFERDLAICRELKDRRGEGNTLNNLGVVYGDWGQYAKAVSHYEKSLATRRELKDRRGEGISLMNLGEVLQHRGEHKQALNNFKKGLAIYTSIKVPTDWPKALIADVYMDEGDLARAEPLLKEADWNTRWGRFFLLKADFPKAKGYYEKILTSAEKNRNASSLFTAYTGLGAAYEGENSDAKALEYYEKAVKYTEDLRSSLSAQEREKFFDVRINGFYRTAPYEGLARVLKRMGKEERAFTTTEFSKARVFAEGMSSRAGKQSFDVPDNVKKRDADLIDQLAALKKQLQKAYEKNNKLSIKALEPQIEKLEKEFAAHKKMLRDKYPLFAATKYPEPMDLSHTALKDDEWVLSYDVTDPGVLIYLTQGKKLVKSVFKPVARKEVDDLVRRFREPLELKADDDQVKKLKAFDFTSGKKLSDILLSDILADLPKVTPLIVIPDDSLGVLPFEMLVLNDGCKIATDKKIPCTTGAEFFGDRNPISYYQSVTALTLDRTFGKHKRTAKKALVMDDPVFSPEDDRLKRIGQSKKTELMGSLPDKLMSIKTELGLTFPRLPLTGELGESLKKLEPRRTEEYSGMEACKRILFKKPLDGYGSMVFATHGYFGKDLPGIQEPVLVLTLVDQPKDQDGFLRLSEVMGLKLNADMVALTACQTGLGRRISGEGTMGMGRAFQYAGAKTVLMSLWSVSENTSVQLVESFFKHLKEGKTKLEALKLARQEIRQAGYDHPFFWAPFILVGEVN